MYTKFKYTIDGVSMEETVYTPSVFEYNNAVTRLLETADKGSVFATTV